MSDLPFIRNFHPGYVLEWPRDIDEALVPEINDAYVNLFEDDPWHVVIVNAHVELSKIDPRYRIVQIKEKFGDLTYYFHTDDPDNFWKMQGIVNNATTIARTITFKAARKAEA